MCKIRTLLCEGEEEGLMSVRQISWPKLAGAFVSDYRLKPYRGGGQHRLKSEQMVRSQRSATAHTAPLKAPWHFIFSEN